VINLSANGGPRADVKTGERVALAVTASVPVGTGTLIGLHWDLDGSGAFDTHTAGVDGSSTEVSQVLDHTFTAPGTYFVSVLAESHREGDVDATSRRVPNLAQVRVVVS
ncbi:MAG: hypothetical protein WCI22_16165, partial [Actinomycetota bacterium]